MFEVKGIKNLDVVSEVSKTIPDRAQQKDWLTVYYSIKDNAVYTEQGEGREPLISLLRYATPEEIYHGVLKALWM